MQVTAQSLFELGVCDRIVPEPVGGAHRHRAAAIASLKDALIAELKDLSRLSADALRLQRAEKFLTIGS
jgi:acetyl-CoA carboxylase carboxyl transferase subunit alpha